MYQHVNMMICYGLNHKYLSRYHQRSYPRSYSILLVISTQSNSSNESQIISSLDMQRTHIVNQVQNTYRNSNLQFYYLDSCNLHKLKDILFIFLQGKYNVSKNVLDSCCGLVECIHH